MLKINFICGAYRLHPLLLIEAAGACTDCKIKKLDLKEFGNGKYKRFFFKMIQLLIHLEK